MSSSKRVTDRYEAAADVAQAARTHGAAVAAKLDGIFSGLLKNGEMPVRWVSLVQVLGRSGLRSAEELVAVDDAYVAEKQDDPPFRKARDTSLAALSQEVSDLRMSVQAAYDDAGLEQLGLLDGPPRTAPPLLRLMDTVISNLSALADLPKVRRGFDAFDAMTYRGPLMEKRDALVAALADVKREGRELEAALVARDETMATHDVHALQCARMLEALFRAAGEATLADRIRATERQARSAGRATVTGDDSADAGGGAETSAGAEKDAGADGAKSAE